MAKAVKVVVDTNIIFSALLNTNSRIAEVLFNSDQILEFYSCDYMRIEIEKHWNKLKKISALSEADLQTAKYHLFNRLNFVNESIIPYKCWDQAEKLVLKIDEDDVDFVALNQYLKGYLWTGDKRLLNGLKKLNYKKY